MLCQDLCKFLSTNVHYCQILVMFPVVSTCIQLCKVVNILDKCYWVSLWVKFFFYFSRISLFPFFHIFHFFTLFIFFTFPLSPTFSRSLRGYWWFLNGGILRNGCPTDTSRKLYINFHISTFLGNAPSPMFLQSVILESKRMLEVPDRSLGGVWNGGCPKDT